MQERPLERVRAIWRLRWMALHPFGGLSCSLAKGNESSFLGKNEDSLLVNKRVRARYVCACTYTHAHMCAWVCTCMCTREGTHPLVALRCRLKDLSTFISTCDLPKLCFGGHMGICMRTHMHAWGSNNRAGGVFPPYFGGLMDMTSSCIIPQNWGKPTQHDYWTLMLCL